MAQQDDKNAQPTKRIYRSSDVHKRSVGASSRSKPAKMPSRKEVRESERETRRISTASRSGRSEQRSASETMPLEAVSTEAAGAGAEQEPTKRTEKASASSARSRFVVIHGEEGSQEKSSDQGASGEKGPSVTNRLKGMLGSQSSTGASDARQAASEVERTAKMPAQVQEQVRAQAAANGRGGSAPSSRRRPRRQDEDGEIGAPVAQQQHVWAGPAKIFLIVLVAALLVTLGVFAFNRWARFDDHADMQGTWYVIGSDVAVTIDADTIYLNDEVSYHYTIDDREKTISYTFGPMEGRGRYWFSGDRKHLAITDGDSFTAAGTTVDDLIKAFLDWSTETGGGMAELPSGEGVIAFSRIPGDIASMPLADELVAHQADDATGSSNAAPAAAEATPSADSQDAQESSNAQEAPADGGDAAAAPAETPSAEESTGENQDESPVDAEEADDGVFYYDDNGYEEVPDEQQAYEEEAA